MSTIDKKLREARKKYWISQLIYWSSLTGLSTLSLHLQEKFSYRLYVFREIDKGIMYEIPLKTLKNKMIYISTYFPCMVTVIIGTYLMTRIDEIYGNPVRYLKKKRYKL